MLLVKIEPNDQKDLDKTTPRKWKVEDLSDDENEAEKPEENRSTKLKSKVFQRFLAQRPVVMPPPPSSTTKSSQMPIENKTLSQAQHFIDLTDDDDDDRKNFVESMSSYSGRPGKKRKLK